MANTAQMRSEVKTSLQILTNSSLVTVPITSSFIATKNQSIDHQGKINLMLFLMLKKETTLPVAHGGRGVWCTYPENVYFIQFFSKVMYFRAFYLI